jgi:hypothetical protein
MEKIKQIGIWMDHSSAILMELHDDTIIESKIVSEFTHQEKENSLMSKGEKHMHIKEHHLQLSYFKKLSEIIRNYQNVILFGPTDAKDELFNLLKTDHLFNNIKIEVKHSDKMTKNKMHDFVKEYFSLVIDQ